MSIIETAETSPAKAITALFYGTSGVGKTRLAGTAGERTLYINTGIGIETLNSAEFLRSFKKPKHIITFTETNLSDRGHVTEATAFDNVCDTLDHWFKTKLDDFDTIVIDDLSFLSTYAQNKALELNHAESRSQAKTRADARKSIVLMGKQDFGTEMQILKWFFGIYIPRCYEMGKHLICLAHERKMLVTPRGPDGKPATNAEPILRACFPLLTGKEGFAPDTVPSFFDVVWHLEGLTGGQGKKVTMARTDCNQIYLCCHTRNNPGFKPLEENPTFQWIHDSIKQGRRL